MFYERQKLCLKKPLTLGAWNHQFSSKDTDIKYFFLIFDNLEPTPGRPAPELEVKAQKIVKQAPDCPN